MNVLAGTPHVSDNCLRVLILRFDGCWGSFIFWNCLLYYSINLINILKLSFGEIRDWIIVTKLGFH